MSNAGVSGVVSAGRTGIAEQDRPAQILAIEEVTAQETVIKCMGRTYSAVASDGEVSITDTTDITRLIQLGTARSRDDSGAWQVVTTRNEHVTTTADLLRAVTALRESARPTFPPAR